MTWGAKWRRLLVLFVLLLVPAAASAAPPGGSAADSVQNLREWQPANGGTVTLDGPWTLYWNRLLEPADFAGANAPDGALTVAVPAQWKSYALDGHALSNEGYGTYRLRFTLSPDAAGEPLGLYINNIATAYKLWINGRPSGGNGVVGIDAGSMTPRNYPKVYFFQPQSGDNELVIQVSNFVQRNGGIWESIELGKATTVAAMHRDRATGWTFLAGSLLLMAVYSAFLYFFRKKERSALWFGLICLAICIRSSLLGESLTYVWFPALSWEWGVKLEYLSEVVTILCTAAFVNEQYPREAVRYVFPAFAAALAGFGVFVLSTPAKVYTQLLTPYILLLLLPVFLYVMYVYILAAVRRRTGSKANAIGFAGFFASVIHESLYYTGFVPFGGLVSFGLLFFLLTQLLNLSALFTKAIAQSELLSLQLSEVIASQENTIRERTASLQELNQRLAQGNRELSRIEHVRSKLLAEVYHDLNTPITSIKGFSKAIMTSVITDKAPQYAKRIYERSLLLEKLIDNVIELSQLRTGETRLQLVRVPLLPFLRQLAHRYEPEIVARELTFAWEEPSLALPPHRELTAAMDPFRFERVYANLIANAVKFTAAGGHIRVWLELQLTDGGDEGRVVLHVVDTGIGIADSELPHIFKRSYQIPGAQPPKTGSGLGLAICTELMKQHHGDIGVRSRPGEGSDFYLTLPVAVLDAGSRRDHQAQGGTHEDDDDFAG